MAMKMQRNIAGVAASIPFAMTAFLTIFNTTVSAAIPQATHNSASRLISLQNPNEYLKLQLLDICRQVNANSSVAVRQDASMNSPILGSLANGSQIFIVNKGSNGWVPIYNPLRGYVQADYLTYCSAPPPSNCRRVKSIIGAVVRQKPSPSSPIVKNLDYGRTVTIINRGTHGWVPITAPVDGYIAARTLSYCPERPLVYRPTSTFM
jgi:uncharacterized protein YgiM (DUF1202 family)